MRQRPVPKPGAPVPRIAIRIMIDDQSVVAMTREYKFIHDLLASGEELPKCAWHRAEEYGLLRIERGADGYAVGYKPNPDKLRSIRVRPQ
jgi:hypothetical protein